MKINLTPEQAERLRRVLKRVACRTKSSESYGIATVIIEEIEAQSEKKKDS